AGFMSTQVAMHADCPVVVVGAAPPDGIVRHGVVVGVDGSAVSDQALCYAFEQASSRRTGLEIVHAWWSTVPAGLTNELRLGQVAEERLAVSESVVGWSERFSDVTVRQHLPLGPAVFALVETAKYAELLVVGSRGQGRLRAVLLGSVSHGVLQHATCPVAVVRQASAVDTHREMVSTSAGSTGFAT
ncbi:MAG: universal stress protein family, partial [Nocardioides sp.]|nr:universal stress protein family [Nocardioides sp.]